MALPTLILATDGTDGTDENGFSISKKHPKTAVIGANSYTSNFPFQK